MYIHYSPQVGTQANLDLLFIFTYSVVTSAHISDHNTTMFCVYLTVPTYVILVWCSCTSGSGVLVRSLSDLGTQNQIAAT